MSFNIPKEIQKLNPRVVEIPEGRKSPLEPAWPKIQTRVSDWNGECPGVSYGIILDAGMLVIDVDTHDPDKDGWTALSNLSDDIGVDLLDVAEVIVSSPSGGAHLYFSKPEELKLPKQHKNYPGLDFLSKGCQVLGAGSKHVTGKKYVVNTEGFRHQDSFDGLSEIPGTLPGRLVKKAPETAPVSPAQQIRSRGQSPLDAFNTCPQAVEYIRAGLEARGYVFTRRSDHYEYIRPNKSDMSFSVSGTLGRRNSNGKYYLKNFSTSDEYFSAEEAVSLSEALRLLDGSKPQDMPGKLLDLGYGEPLALETEGDPLFDHLLGKSGEPVETTGDQLNKSFGTKKFGDRRAEFGDDPKRRPYIVEGLIREGEVCNIIASPKVGKSWLVHGLAISFSEGLPYLGYKATRKLRVLICDNELHEEELYWRLSTIAKSMGVEPSDLEYKILRGSNVDVYQLDEMLDSDNGSDYDLVIIDALYRILPEGTSENDNAQITRVFNKLDNIAKKNDCAVINIHHSSKGNQGDKAVTDVGAGAGAISRAADVHIAIREHQEDGLAVIDAITRSSQSPESISAKLNWPVWEVQDVDPVVKSFEAGRKQINDQRVKTAEEKMEYLNGVISEITEDNPVTAFDMFQTIKLDNVHDIGDVTALKKVLKKASQKGFINEVKPQEGQGNMLRYFHKPS